VTRKVVTLISHNEVKYAAAEGRIREIDCVLTTDTQSQISASDAAGHVSFHIVRHEVATLLSVFGDFLKVGSRGAE
jgi:hypothetical protein